MSTAISQIVTVGAGGLVEVRSPELHEGDQAQVTVVVMHPAGGKPDNAGAGGWRRFAGAIKTGDARAGDNERIDADLAAQFGSGTKRES